MKHIKLFEHWIHEENKELSNIITGEILVDKISKIPT
jgi:hypothetical protein